MKTKFEKKRKCRFTVEAGQSCLSHSLGHTRLWNCGTRKTSWNWPCWLSSSWKGNFWRCALGCTWRTRTDGSFPAGIQFDVRAGICKSKLIPVCICFLFSYINFVILQKVWDLTAALGIFLIRLVIFLVLKEMPVLKWCNVIPCSLQRVNYTLIACQFFVCLPLLKWWVIFRMYK